MPEIKGLLVEDESRCEHYATAKDIVAIKFYCCKTYYPCFKCHEACTNHAVTRWPRSEFNQKAILCGVCKTEQTITSYMENNQCSACTSSFNEGCRNHYHIYFET